MTNRAVEHAAAQLDQMHEGHRVGDTVRIGTGTKDWTLVEFWVATASGAVMASLQQADGYTRTSAEVDRLVAVK